MKIVLFLIFGIAFSAEYEQEQKIAAIDSPNSVLQKLIQGRELIESSQRLKDICAAADDDHLLLRFNQKLSLYLLPRLNWHCDDGYDMPDSADVFSMPYDAAHEASGIFDVAHAIPQAYKEIPRLFPGRFREQIKEALLDSGLFKCLMQHMAPFQQEDIIFHSHEEYEVLSFFLKHISGCPYRFSDETSAELECLQSVAWRHRAYLQDAAYKLIDATASVSLHKPNIPAKKLQQVGLAYAMILHDTDKERGGSQKYLSYIENHVFLKHISAFVKEMQGHFDIYNKIIITDVQKTDEPADWN